jgi:hypothetical protein
VAEINTAQAREHFREAEACLSASEYQRQEGDIEGATLEVAHAQAHAMLALAGHHLVGGSDPRDAEADGPDAPPGWIERTRLRLAREALMATGYFQADEVDDDIAPRITELDSARRAEIERLRRAEAEVTRLRQLVGDENVGPNWDCVDRAEAIRQANEFHADRLKWMEDHDRRRDERDEAIAERDRLRQELDWMAGQPQGSNPYWQQRSKRVEAERDVMAEALVAMQHVLTTTEARLTKKPAEPRRWVAGDPEPEAGTRVYVGGTEIATLRADDTWHWESCESDCRSAGPSWSELIAQGGGALVEVVGDRG